MGGSIGVRSCRWFSSRQQEKFIIGGVYLDLLAIKEGRDIFNAIWSYDLHSDTRIDEETWHKAEKLLNSLLDEIIKGKGTITEHQVKCLFANTVLELESLFGDSPLYDGGIYEYGGLNCFFANIMTALKFQVKKGKHYWISNFVYGLDFEDG